MGVGANRYEQVADRVLNLINNGVLKEDILIAPGRMFSVKERYTNCLRLNAGTWDHQVESAVQYLGKLCGNSKTMKKPAGRPA